MDLGMYNNTLQFTKRVFDTRSSTVPIIRTTPDKPAFSPAPIKQPFPRVAPEEKGLPSELLLEFLRRYRDDKRLDMHSVTVLRDGAIVAEADFGAYDRSVWHCSFSECKSVVSLAIGMLVGEGKLDLDKPIVKILADRVPVLAQLTMKELTVRHLLTMTSGVNFNEAGAVTDTDWVKGFFESKINGEPGEKFFYNSMNTYMLSVIVREVSGLPLTEYLRPRLWEPLGIEKVFWEKCPMGIEKGGWGLYLRQEDFLKIAQLVMDGGRWQGKQLVPESYIKEATSTAAIAPENYGHYNYGYQFWVGRGHEAFLFNGMFGQNLICFPESRIIVATNGGVEDVFQDSNLFYIAEELFGGKFPDTLPENPRGAARLRELCLSLCERSREESPVPEECALLEGRRYELTSDNAPSLGLLPLSMQSTQNIHTRGMKSLSFSMRGGAFTMTVEENDESYDLRLGFGRPEYSTLCFHGETNIVGGSARFGRDEDGRLVLILRASFLEATGARHIRLYFERDYSALTARWEETPGYKYILRHIDLVLGSGGKLPARIGGLLSRTDTDYLHYRLKVSLDATFEARLVKE